MRFNVWYNEKMKKTKKNVLGVSFVATVVYLSMIFSRDMIYDSCVGGKCILNLDIFDFIAPFVFIFPVVLLLSLITYKLREETFRAWLHFAYGFVPLSIFLTFLARNSSGGSMGIPNILDQETVAFLLSALFLIISLVIIIYQWYKKLPE